MIEKTPQKPQPSQRQHKPYEQDNMSLIDILLVFVKHLKLIIIIPMIFCMVNIIYVFFIADKIYVSTATFMSSASSASSSNNSQMMNLANQFGFTLPQLGSSNLEWPYEEVIRSRTIAKKLLKYQFNTKKYGPNKELLQILMQRKKK